MQQLTVPPDLAKSVIRSNMTLICIFIPVLWLPNIPLLINALSNQDEGNATIPLLMLSLFLLLSVALVLGTWLLARLSVRKTRIEFGDGQYRFVNWGSHDRSVSAASIERAVLVEQMGLSGTNPTHHLIVLGRQGERLTHFVGQMFYRSQFHAVVQDMQANGAAVNVFNEPITPPQLRAIDRRLLSWRRAYPFLFALAIIGPLLVLVIIALIIVFGFITQR
ncbi:MAG: hypothetical protein ACTHXA_02430 [Gulosibacter sp.]|uniref:hypothetical protein n=1 Tax=Gulosibacter sp. TaxID=2817531 RepID=UPI003F8EEA07